MRRLLAVISMITLSILAAEQGTTTVVTVYAEGGYTETHLTVRVFADISPDQEEGSLHTAGVKLTYPAALLAGPVPTGNETDWYFGLPENTFTYCTPDISVEGEIIFLSAKLDQDNPAVGVEGKRILLGSAVFEREPGSVLPLPDDFSLAQGKEQPFVDFVSTEGAVLDDAVIFNAPTINSLSNLYLGGVIRILRMVTGQQTDVPLRPAELDKNDSGQVGLDDVIALMRLLSE